MKLHDPGFLRAFTRQFRAARRRDRELRRAIRRHRRPNRNSLAVGIVIRVAIGLVPACLLCAAHDQGWPTVCEPVIASWWFLELVILGQTVVANQSRNLPPALYGLPIGNDDLRRLARDHALGLLWRPFMDALPMMIVLAWLHEAGAGGWLAVVPLAALCAVSAWSGSIALARRPPPGTVTAVAYLIPVSFMLIGGLPWVQTWLLKFCTDNASWLTLLSPGGWISAAYLAGLGELPRPWLTALLPAIVLAAMSIRLLARFLRELDFDALLSEPYLAVRSEDTNPAEELTAADFALSAVKTEPEAARDMDESDIEAAWRAPFEGAAEAAWLERLFLRWLTPRERLVLECAASRVPHWTKSVRRGTIALGLGLLVLRAARVPELPGGLLTATGSILLVVGAITALPLASGFDRMVGSVFNYGLAIARPALYPLGIREFARLSLKAAVIRGAAMVPIMALTGALLAAIFGWGSVRGGGAGVRLALVSIAAAPGLCMLAFSSVSDDSHRGCLRAVWFAVLIIGVTVTLILLGGAAVLAPTPWAWGATAAFAVIAALGTYLYARAYERGRLDLVRRPQE